MLFNQKQAGDNYKIRTVRIAQGKQAVHACACVRENKKEIERKRERGGKKVKETEIERATETIYLGERKCVFIFEARPGDQF